MLNLDDLQNVKALVLGDAIIDVYHFGRVDRISPEAPVPIFVPDTKNIQSRRGGADNVAHQLEALHCHTFKHLSKNPSVKHRYMVGTHQVFRVDYDSEAFGEVYKKDIAWFDPDMGQADKLDVIILSDYNKNFLTPRVCQDIILRARDANIPVVVDPKGTDWRKYEGASILCPNEKEWKQVGEIIPPGADLVVKRGEKGLQIRYNGHADVVDIPTRARQIFDVTGAGDTVVAVLSACIGAKASLEDAAYIANAAAGYVVGELGTSICPLETLKELV